jgi:hypothetical protein
MTGPTTTGDDPRVAEVTLLAALRGRQADLKALLDASSGHWGYEDPVYRFYHQSFKVYALQDQTTAIVRMLASLAPDRPLNASFLEIIREGTDKQFKPEDNAAWLRVTRPIVEAFFHTRFFLEMAVRYAALEAPPNPLPSGYAALLYLYDLR